MPGKTFWGKVTEIGNSPIQTTGSTAETQATNFLVKVTLDTAIPDVRPGFTCTAEITTATRKNVVAVPIQSLTVREMLYDQKGALVHEPPPPVQRRFFGGAAPAAPTPPPDPPPGQTRKETEGVFVVRDGRVVFQPVKVGVAGERYFEVASGLKAGDQVVTGPFSSVRELADGSAVMVNKPR